MVGCFTSRICIKQIGFLPINFNKILPAPPIVCIFVRTPQPMGLPPSMHGSKADEGNYLKELRFLPAAIRMIRNGIFTLHYSLRRSCASRP